MVWHHLFSGHSYVPDMDNLGFVKMSVKVLNALLRPLGAVFQTVIPNCACSVALDGAQSQIFQVNGRQAITFLWLVMQGITFWTFMWIAHAKERRLREEYLRKHVRDDRRRGLVRTHHWITMASVQMYIVFSVLQRK
eukprot:jgi/Botrbrau1/14951/Bobra.0018s0055.2